MACSDILISLVYSKPEVWDQGHMDYSSKNLKVKAWTFIAEKLGVTVECAKSRWTNLRDLFRRELKKTLRLAEESGDPDAHRPRWKHFRSMLFLKDQMVKDEPASASAASSSTLHFDEQYAAHSSLYPHTILEDGDMVRYDEDAFHEEEEGAESSTGSIHHQELSSSRPTKRMRRSNPRWSNEGYLDHLTGGQPDQHAAQEKSMDEDHHFVLSVLPSIRRIARTRKTAFRLKVLQLIADEENAEASEA